MLTNSHYLYKYRPAIKVKKDRPKKKKGGMEDGRQHFILPQPCKHQIKASPMISHWQGDKSLTAWVTLTKKIKNKSKYKEKRCTQQQPRHKETSSILLSSVPLTFLKEDLCSPQNRITTKGSEWYRWGSSVALFGVLTPTEILWFL